MGSRPAHAHEAHTRWGGGKSKYPPVRRYLGAYAHAPPPSTQRSEPLLPSEAAPRPPHVIFCVHGRSGRPLRLLHLVVRLAPLREVQRVDVPGEQRLEEQRLLAHPQRAQRRRRLSVRAQGSGKHLLARQAKVNTSRYLSSPQGMVGREGREGGRLSRSLANDEAPEQCCSEAAQQRSVAVLVRLERVPYHLCHLQASGKWMLE